MKMHTTQGFTFIELIAAMAVAAILLGIGIPSFTNAVKNSRIGEQSRGLIGSLYIARSEAIKSGSRVTVCARKNNNKCGTDWSNGWIVFIDTVTTDDVSGKAVISAGDEKLDIRDSLNGNSLSTVGVIAGSSSPASTRHFVRYSPNGGTNWNSGTFLLCDDRTDPEKYARSINIVLTGDIRAGRKNSAGIPMDATNQAVDCAAS